LPELETQSPQGIDGGGGADNEGKSTATDQRLLHQYWDNEEGEQ
jgi:hypothetical protein